MYEIVEELSAPAGALTLGVAAINDNNMIVGSFLTTSFTFRPYMWTAETGVVPIPLPPGVSEAWAEDVNNNGEIAGRLTRTGVSGMRAFRYKDGVWIELPPTGSGIHSEAFGINDDGWVVGYRDTDKGRKAFRWRGEVVEELSSPIGGSTFGTDVNNTPVAVGWMGQGGTGNSLGFIWDGDFIAEIPPLPEANRADPIAVNDSEVVTGEGLVPVKTGSVPRRSWVFDHGELTDLGALPGLDHRINAFDMNDAGHIIGRSQGIESASFRAFLWQNGQMVNLETLVVDPPAFLWLGGATAINNNGFIVASNQAFGGQFILAPVNRPLGDVNIDCVVDERDLIAVLDDWGPDKAGHPTDMVSSATFQPPGDGIVDAADLAVVLGNWTSSGSQSLPKRYK